MSTETEIQALLADIQASIAGLSHRTAVLEAAPAGESISRNETPALQPSGDVLGLTDANAIMAAVEALPLVSGIPSGRVRLAAGNFNIAPGIIKLGPHAYVEGEGRWATNLVGVGKGDVVRLQNLTYGGGGLWGGGLRALTIDGKYCQEGSVGLRLGDAEALELDITIHNFTAPGSVSLYFQNTIWWTEKTKGNVFLRNNATACVFDVAGEATASFSFGYTTLNLDVEILAGQAGVVLKNGAQLYHSRLVIKGDCTGAKEGAAQPLLEITGQVPAGHPNEGQYTQIYGGELHIQVEQGTPNTFPMRTINFGSAGNNFIKGCTGELMFQGTWTSCNANITTTANALWFQGPIYGDVNLAPNTAYRLPTIAGPLMLSKAFLSGGNGNAFVGSGDMLEAILTANITINLAANTPPAGPQRKTFIIKQAAAGGPFTVTWPNPAEPTILKPAVWWPGGAAPVMSAGAGATDVYVLETNDGVRWYGRAYQNLK